MRTAGIIAEYNPFHLGHQYQLQETRKQTGADYLVVVMSGNFVQRGEPAVFEKSLRAQMALLCGADLVLELPAPFASGSAEDFASAAVSLLDRLGVISFLSFGSEIGQLDILQEAALCLSEEPEPFCSTLKYELRQGASFPSARQTAMAACGLSDGALKAADSPNNLLGIEYLKALKRQNSPILPLTIRREGCGYHDTTLADKVCRSQNISFASASALRLELWKNAQNHPQESGSKLLTPALKQQLPAEILPLYYSGKLLPVFPEDCSSMLSFRILSCQADSIPFQSFSDLSDELAGRLEKQAQTALSFAERIAALKTRQYTYTRVSRSLTHLLLGIRQEDMNTWRKEGYCSYARVLGFRKSAAPLLRAIKENSRIPLITKAADARFLLPPCAESLWKQDIFCSHLYHVLVKQRYGISPANEYSRPLVLL